MKRKGNLCSTKRKREREGSVDTVIRERREGDGAETEREMSEQKDAGREDKRRSENS